MQLKKEELKMKLDGAAQVLRQRLAKVNAKLETLRREVTKKAQEENQKLDPQESLVLTLGISLFLMGLFVKFPNPITFLLAVVVIGFRQLTLVDMQARASKGKLLEDKKKNDELGSWACSYPLFSNTEDHESIYGVLGRSATPTLKRRNEKRLCAAVGFTGIERIYAVAVINLGLGYVAADGTMKYMDRKTVTGKELLSNFKDGLGRIVLTQLALLIVSVATGYLSAYLIWLVSYLTACAFFLELRREKEVESLGRTLDEIDLSASFVDIDVDRLLDEPVPAPMGLSSGPSITPLSSSPLDSIQDSNNTGDRNRPTL